jgi:hypothetical protein
MSDCHYCFHRQRETAVKRLPADAKRALDALRKSKYTGVHASYVVTAEDMEHIAASLVNGLYGRYTPVEKFDVKQKREHDVICHLLNALDHLHNRLG